MVDLRINFDKSVLVFMGEVLCVGLLIEFFWLWRFFFIFYLWFYYGVFFNCKVNVEFYYRKVLKRVWFGGDLSYF